MNKWTTLKGIAHLWKSTPTKRGAPYWTSVCGQVKHNDDLQCTSPGDRKCRRCFPVKPKKDPMGNHVPTLSL
jgi:hypothetical protein